MMVGEIGSKYGKPYVGRQAVEGNKSKIPQKAEKQNSTNLQQKNPETKKKTSYNIKAAETIMIWQETTDYIHRGIR